MQEPITSSENRWLKRLRRAAERHDEEIVLEGPKQLSDALAHGMKPIAVFVRDDVEMPPGVEAKTAFIVADRAFRTVADTSTSQGIVALFARPRTSLASITDSGRALVALDAVQDPGNVGAVVRLAAAFELGGVVALSGTADPFSPRAIRGSAGAVLTTPVATDSASAFLAECARRGRPLFAAMPEGPSIADIVLPRDAVVVMGSEGRGVAPEIREAARPFSIPTSRRVESLNVATAAAIVIWELRRRTG
jgi:RNA methyltransferase, TrmH family